MTIGGAAALVIFIDTEPAPELFFCNGQLCNVILIIPESVSARHMGIYGYERDTTPFIDEFFGKEGIVFENAWSTAPWTWPSFVALYTSQLAPDVFVEYWQDKLSDTTPTFIDVLKKNKIPKLLIHTWTIFPHDKLDSFIMKFEPEERFQGEDAFLFLKASEWIEERARKGDGQPFFLFLQPSTPHAPYDPPEPYRYFFDAPSEYPGQIFGEIAKVQQALDRGENVEVELKRFRLQYDQEIRYLDSQIESFVLRIPEKILRNTVIIFTSDHGQALGQHINIANVPHRGTLYEEEIHIPFLIKAPGVNSTRVYEPISLLDAGPTILDIFGFESPDSFRGTSLLSTLQGEKLQTGVRIVRAENVHGEIIDPEIFFKIEPKIRLEALPYPREIAVRKGKWKLIRRADNSFELYNLKNDHNEQNNLILQQYSLLEEERTKIIPLFEELNKILYSVQ